MRYYELLENEEDSTIIDILKKECSDIIEIYSQTKKFLYRGMRERGLENVIDNLSYSFPRENRNPINSELEFQNAVDRYLIANKFKAIRSNSYFCTSKEEVAKFYGALYAIFPANGFNFTWFKNSEDLFQLDEYFSKRTIADNEFRKKTANEKKVFEDNIILEIMAKIQPSKLNLNDAIKSGHEIMFTGKYYCLPKGKNLVNIRKSIF